MACCPRARRLEKGTSMLGHPRHDKCGSGAPDEATCGLMSHPVLEGKPNVNHVRARIRNSGTQRLHNWTSSHIAQSK
jgi:hypothetical protein